MKITIALDDDLMRLQKEFEQEGFRVVDKTMAAHADALVVSGMENNFMNMQDIKTSKKVIDATGKSAKEIAEEIKI